MRQRFPGFSAGLLAVALTGACASTAEDSATEGEQAYAVEVRNTGGSTIPLDVYLVPLAGHPRLIGRVNPNEVATLRFDEIAVGPYRFRARTVEGREFSSGTFTLAGTSVVEWNLTNNRVSILERR